VCKKVGNGTASTSQCSLKPTPLSGRECFLWPLSTVGEGQFQRKLIPSNLSGQDVNCDGVSMASHTSGSQLTTARPYPSKSNNARATTFVARRRSSSTRCSSARFAFDSSTVRGPAP